MGSARHAYAQDDGQIDESARGWKQRAQFDLPNVTAC